jgi:hypothetical protein
LPSCQSPRSILRCMAFTEYPVSICASGSSTYRAGESTGALWESRGRSRMSEGVPIPGLSSSGPSSWSDIAPRSTTAPVHHIAPDPSACGLVSVFAPLRASRKADELPQMRLLRAASARRGHEPNCHSLQRGRAFCNGMHRVIQPPRPVSFCDGERRRRTPLVIEVLIVQTGLRP